jgi:ABC-type multidrug transport system ATPase subunit
MGEVAIKVRGLRKELRREEGSGRNRPGHRGKVAGRAGRAERAGKTTSLSMMTGLLRPGVGQIVVTGWTVLDLASDVRRLVADYSTGMRKKATLGCAPIRNPKVLFLDEPLEGVDPISADVIVSVDHSPCRRQGLRRGKRGHQPGTCLR